MGGGALYAPPSLFLCLLPKISLGNPYLEMLDLTKLFYKTSEHFDIWPKGLNTFCQPFLEVVPDSGPKRAATPDFRRWHTEILKPVRFQEVAHENS